MSSQQTQIELTPEEAQQIKKWLDEKGVVQTCQACSTGKYELLNIALRIPVGTLDGSMELYRHTGVVPARCTNCAHIRFFDTHVIGIRRSVS